LCTAVDCHLGSVHRLAFASWDHRRYKARRIQSEQVSILAAQSVLCTLVRTLLLETSMSLVVSIVLVEVEHDIFAGFFVAPYGTAAGSMLVTR
jgi:hypothetical protein